MKIAVKTKITEWGAAGDKEKISFDILDFSPDQVGDIDRLIRNNSEDPVSLSIEPIQKKLQIAPIVSQVRLVSMNCMTGGQKLKIADFKSPDERATAMKRLTASDTQITLTLEDVQGKLFDEQKETNKIDFDKADYKVNENGVVVNPKQIIVNFPKGYNTTCTISYAFSEKWFSGYDIKIGHIGSESWVDTNDPGFVNLNAALDNASVKIFDFIEAQKKYKYKKQAATAVIKAVENYLESQNERAAISIPVRQ